MTLNALSHERLSGVHPHLVKIIHRADGLLSEVDPTLSFQITEGVRSVARQKQLVAKGASRTMNSRHIPAKNGFSHAVDIVIYLDGRISWEFPLYKTASDAVKRAASELGYKIEWGGDWKSFKDGPHFQLPFSLYPGTSKPGDLPASKSTDDDNKTLVIGSSGALVIKLQNALNDAGASIEVDGDFGSKTFALVKRFQAGEGLKADGIVGPRTWEALGNG